MIRHSDEIHQLRAEIERLRAAIQAYLDYCEPEDKWQGDPVLLRIRRQMRAAFGDEQQAQPKHTDRSTPCPTCGFVVREVERQPFVFRDER